MRVELFSEQTVTTVGVRFWDGTYWLDSSPWQVTLVLYHLGAPHQMSIRGTDQRRRGRSFSDEYVFPDGKLMPISTSLHIAEEMAFEVRDVEGLREHYAMTLRHWVSRLETHHEQALQFVDEPAYHVCRLFMSDSAHGFINGWLDVHQTLLVKPDHGGQGGLPLTRADLYSG